MYVAREDAGLPRIMVFDKEPSKKDGFFIGEYVVLPVFIFSDYKRYILRAKETINYKCGTIEKGKEVEIFRYRNKWVFLYSWNYCLAQLKYFDVVREVA